MFLKMQNVYNKPFKQNIIHDHLHAKYNHHAKYPFSCSNNITEIEILERILLLQIFKFFRNFSISKNFQ